MEKSGQRRGSNSNHEYAHERHLLVQQLDREIIFPLESQRLFASRLGAGKKDGGSDSLGRSSILRYCGIRRLDVIHVDVGDFDVFRLELATEAGAIKAGAEDSSFVGIHINRNLVLSCSGLDDLLNHRCSRSPTGKNDRRDIFLQEEVN